MILRGAVWFDVVAHGPDPEHSTWIDSGIVAANERPSGKSKHLGRRLGGLPEHDARTQRQRQSVPAIGFHHTGNGLGKEPGLYGAVLQHVAMDKKAIDVRPINGLFISLPQHP